jgi:hypothetical protein
LSRLAYLKFCFAAERFELISETFDNIKYAAAIAEASGKRNSYDGW